MKNNDFLKALVMDAIANDYEEYPIVIKEVTTWAAERGVAASQSEIVEALAGLVELGLAKAYRLSPSEPAEELPDFPRLDRAVNCFFMLTPAGKKAIRDY